MAKTQNAPESVPQPVAKATGAKSRTPAKRAPEWTFPRKPLEEAIHVAQAIEDKHAGNPMRAEELARAVGFKRSDDWRFIHLLHSARLYGLVSGTGAKATVSLEQIGQDIVSPSSPEQRQKALLAAFNQVEEFRRVAEFYRGKKIPEDEFFSNTLTREFNVPRERVDQFIQVFLRDLEFLKGFNVGGGTRNDDRAAKGTVATEVTALDTSAEETSVRQFLDTCFVLMPFGEWFDRYYKEIYVPAIKDAGFEPVRADELFKSGTVIEQISEQIGKSKVLMADLTDKNANVFYELGLAHRSSKPVVLAAAKADDIPFDLRHLRAIIYETREPDWGVKLRKSITVYLKNAKADPEKSIPHPFRQDSSTKPEEGAELQNET